MHGASPVSSSQRSFSTQLREYCKAHDLSFDVISDDRGLAYLIDGERLAWFQAANKYLAARPGPSSRQFSR